MNTAQLGIMIPNSFGLMIVDNSFGSIRTIGLLRGIILPNIGDYDNPIEESRILGISSLSSNTQRNII